MLVFGQHGGGTKTPQKVTMTTAKYSILVRWTVVDGGARTELPVAEQVKGEADGALAALAVADKLMAELCAKRGGGAGAVVRRLRDGDKGEVYRLDGLEGDTFELKVRRHSNKCSRLILERQAKTEDGVAKRKTKAVHVDQVG